MQRHKTQDLLIIFEIQAGSHAAAAPCTYACQSAVTTGLRLAGIALPKTGGARIALETLTLFPGGQRRLLSPLAALREKQRERLLRAAPYLCFGRP